MCGQSIQNRRLFPNQYWQLSVPIYKGSFKTKFRLKLKFGTRAIGWKLLNVLEESMERFMEKEGTLIYSNEWEGYMNPAQFWGYQRNYFAHPFEKVYPTK